MAVESTNEVDSGVASSEVTPVNKESSSLTPPDTISQFAEMVLENVTTPGVAAINKEESLAQLKKNSAIEDTDDFEDIDESLAERLMGLTEMFPSGLRSATSNLGHKSARLVAAGYAFTRGAVWCICTTSLLLFAPVLFVVERVNAEEMIKQDRNKLVLGPGSAMSGGPPSGGMMMPPPPLPSA